VTETPHIASVPQISRPVGVRRRCCERRLTRTEEQDTIIINRSGRSTYLGKKSVLTSGATPVIAATAQSANGNLPQDFFDRFLTAERDGNLIKIRSAPLAANLEEGLRIVYTISVPDWIEVNSTVKSGNQTIAGVRGPVKIVSGTGDIKASYITSSLDASTGNGNIAVVRVGAAAKVATGSGNISLRDIGPASAATVRSGTGRIEMDGVSGAFTGSTEAGEIDAKGQVFGDWSLQSVSGGIFIEIGAETKEADDAQYDVDVATRTGRVLIENKEINICREANLRRCHTSAYGGGKSLRVRSDTGTIVIK
jgi:hypothetical protein